MKKVTNLFTEPPDFEANFGWASFIGKYVIVEPVSYQENLTTKFGVQNAWDCIVWELTTDNELTPHSGIRIFNPRLIDALTLAYRTGRPLAGHVHKGGNNASATVVENDKSPAMELLAKLWAKQTEQAQATIGEAF